jgi:transposase InsO family protein
MPQRHKKRRRLYHKDASIIRLRPTHPNHVWSIDFVHDKLDSGRSYKMLTVLDEYTRQALAVAVRIRMGAEGILEALYPLLLRRGTPEYIRSDNGPEFVAEAMQDWLARSVSSLSGSIPGHPGRMDTTNDLTELCAARCSTPNGSPQQSRLRSSSTSG